MEKNLFHYCYLPAIYTFPFSGFYFESLSCLAFLLSQLELINLIVSCTPWLPCCLSLADFAILTKPFFLASVHRLLLSSLGECSVFLPHTTLCVFSLNIDCVCFFALVMHFPAVSFFVPLLIGYFV